MTAKRLNNYGIINREKPLRFYWDGRALPGYVGDTLASALLAAGQTPIARSFKYHRPRGISSAGVEEATGLVTIGRGAHTVANTPATVQELYDGLEAFGQNAYPNVRFDVGAVANVFGRFFAAGFYYKTFMGLPPFEWGAGRGTKIWMWYEKFIRRAAGMGAASRLPDPDAYQHQYAFCDLLVVGGGVAGLTAAIAAAQKGLDVLLVEQDFEWGGDALAQAGDEKSDARRRQLTADAKAAGVRMMRRTTAFGLYDNDCVGLTERVGAHCDASSASSPPVRERIWQVQTRHTIIAAGAIERHFVFGNNDLPGVMTANAARHYLNRFGVLVGQKIVIATNNDSVYATAADLKGAGAEVTVVDVRESLTEELLADIQQKNINLLLNQSVASAVGSRQVKAVNIVRKQQNEWRDDGRRENCDALLVSGGWSPTVHLLSHRGLKPQWDDAQCCLLVRDEQKIASLDSAGAVNGLWQTADCIASGEAAGLRAVAMLKKGTRESSADVAGGWQNPIAPLYEVDAPSARGKSFVDLQHDVTAEDVRLAQREGFESVEHLKRYTTLGMAADQGKTSNVLGMALMAQAGGKDIAQSGITTFRPPYTPVSIGALAGRNTGAHFRPLRRSPMHDWHLAHNAVMTMAGLWHRPWYYAQGADDTVADAYKREAKTVRETVGLCDVTSLGKIAVVGVDATELLNRIYANAFAKLAVGKARYGVMLRDDGLVMDDGTAWRLSENEYFMTTTTANAAKVMAFMEELLQTRWCDLKVHLTSVTDQWAGCAVAGPKSREVLSACLIEPQVIANENCPPLAVVAAKLSGGVPCRIARISFSGERAYEVYVPADYGTAMMELLWVAAQSHGGCLYGLEALGTLRIEKGHITAAELDGRVTIEDAGLGKMASVKKYYVGSVLKNRPELTKAGRAQLVGLVPCEQSQTFKVGSLLCAPDKIEGRGIGWVTSVTHSPALGHWIGLGFVEGGLSAWGEQTLIAANPVHNAQVAVRAVSPHFYDANGERMRG